jgi:NADPH:quinone reductase-like Zn-dependent oxidoreductase
VVKVERPDPKPAYRQVVVKVKACIGVHRRPRH